MSTAGYLVEAPTCGKCLAKVLEKVRSLAGVTLRPRRATPVQIVKECCLPSEV